MKDGERRKEGEDHAAGRLLVRKGWMMLNEVEEGRCITQQVDRSRRQTVRTWMSRAEHILRSKMYLDKGMACPARTLPVTFRSAPAHHQPVQCPSVLKIRSFTQSCAPISPPRPVSPMPRESPFSSPFSCLTSERDVLSRVITAFPRLKDSCSPTHSLCLLRQWPGSCSHLSPLAATQARSDLSPLFS